MTSRKTVIALSTTVVVHVTTFILLEFTYSPINSLSFTSLSMIIRITGSNMPFIVWERNMIM